jgi:hypothetical protein
LSIIAFGWREFYVSWLNRCAMIRGFRNYFGGSLKSYSIKRDHLFVFRALVMTNSGLLFLMTSQCFLINRKHLSLYFVGSKNFILIICE